MKSAVLYTLIAAFSVFGLNVSAQSTCTEGGHQPGVIDPYAAIGDVPYCPSDVAPSVYPVAPSAGTSVAPSVASQSAPQARITVVDASPKAAPVRAASASLSARITVVADTPKDVSKVAAADVDSANEETESINPALKSLVGTWMAVSRYGDGELATVELQLDDRGWAKFTVPGSDGKPTSVKRRVELENKELKLVGPDAELSLGKLIDVTSRQMVLAGSAGQMTFVRL